MLRYKVLLSFLGGCLYRSLRIFRHSWPYVVACAVPWLLRAGQRCATRLLGWRSSGGNWVVLAVVVQMGDFCWVALPF